MGWKSIRNIIISSQSPEDGGLKIFHQSLGWFSLVLFFIFDAGPRFQPKLDLFKIDEVVFAHGKPSANSINFVLLHVPGLAETGTHFGKSDDALALDFIVAFALSLLLDQADDLFDLVFGQPRKCLLFAQLQLLDELHLLAQQQHHKTYYLLIHTLLDGNSAVTLQPYCRNVLQRLDSGRVDQIEESNEVHFLLVPVQSQQDLEFIVSLDNPILLQQLKKMFSSDEPLSSGNIVEQGERMEIRPRGDGFAIGLQHIFLLFQQQEIPANAVEDISLFELCPFGDQALLVHNDYILQTSIQYRIIIVAAMQEGKERSQCIIINADDYGCNSDIDRGIVQLIRDRHINSTSVLVNGEDVERAAEKLKEIIQEKPDLERSLSVGLHFNLTQGKPLSQSILQSQLVKDGEFVGKPKIYQIAQQPNTFKACHIAEQLNAQVERFIELFGRRPSHMDGHNHVHIIPSIAEPLAEAMSLLGIYKTRIPLEKLQTITLPLNHQFLAFAESSKQIYARKGIIHTKSFVGLQSFGNPSPDLLRNAAEGQKEENYVSVEMMCHPGYASQKGNQWVMSQDRFTEMELLSRMFGEFKRHGCYHDLKNEETNQLRALVCYNRKQKEDIQFLQNIQGKLRQKNKSVLFWVKFQQITYKINKLDLELLISNMNITHIIELSPSSKSQYVKEISQTASKPYQQITNLDDLTHLDTFFFMSTLSTQPK